MIDQLLKHGFWLVILLALALRLPPMLLEQPNGHDQLEYENVAENLAQGRGFMTDIKIYHAVNTPVRHYAGYDRPILLPVILAGMRAVLPSRVASRLIGPLLFLIALGLIYRAVAAVEGREAALACGVLLGSQPVLLNATIGPLSEATSVVTLAFLIYALVHRRSAWMTGLACSLMFLSRPGSLISALIVFVPFALAAARERQIKPLLLFCGFALLGPVVQLAVNLLHGAPALTLPQQSLFQVMHYTDQQRYFHRHPVYGSRLELLGEQGGWVLKTITRHTVGYIQYLIGTKMLIAVLPLAAMGVFAYTRDKARLRRWLPILLIALAEFAFYCMAWSTWDPWRFQITIVLVVTLLAAIGIAHCLPRRGMLLAGVGMVCMLWGLLNVDASKRIWTDYLRGRTLANMEHEWDAPGRQGAMEHLREAAAGRTPIVASNQPWAVHWYTRLPVVLLPDDLIGDEPLRFLDRYGADLLVIHHSAWDPRHAAGKRHLIGTLAMSQWEMRTIEGDFEIWRRTRRDGTANQEMALDALEPVTSEQDADRNDE